LSEKKERKGLKDFELRLISELMKNSRRSDRELARSLKVSQPTVTRTRSRLEREGYIREYTAIPDFAKLGYQIMGVSFAKATDSATDGSGVESRKAVAETERTHTYANLMGLRGIGLQKDILFITFYKNYAAYTEAMQRTKTIPHLSMQSVESFVVDLNDKNNYRVLTMAQIARHIHSSE
jgi:DNA-binding Lrp family transcriptional regulator